MPDGANERGRTNQARRRRLGVVSLLSLITGLALTVGVPSASPAGAQGVRTFRFEGGGWGHGVGMSQYGAYGMAKKGSLAGDIITHYYQGSAIERRDSPELRIWIEEASTVTLAATGLSGAL